jgi:hypothetical protein
MSSELPEKSIGEEHKEEAIKGMISIERTSNLLSNLGEFTGENRRTTCDKK